MNTSTLMKIVLSTGAVDAISKAAGIDPDQTKKVLNLIVPTLMGGATKQATGKDTAESFAKAILDHADADTRDLAGFFGKVDTTDGGKIVDHLLGTAATTALVKIAAKSVGLNEKTVKLIITMVSPLLMSILGQQKKKHGDNGSELLKDLVAGTAEKVLGGNGGLLGGVVGKLLG